VIEAVYVYIYCISFLTTDSDGNAPETLSRRNATAGTKTFDRTGPNDGKEVQRSARPTLC